MTAEELRDSVLSEVGLDENGKKQYDLGNQTITVALQKDMSFSITLDESEKTVKSIPKKGADVEKYAIAMEDYSRMKKDVKSYDYETDEYKHRYHDIMNDEWYEGDEGFSGEDW